MIDKNGWRHLAMFKDIDGQGDELGTIAFREIGDGSDQAGAGAPHFGARFHRCILTDY